jgi:hypothetical protein
MSSEITMGGTSLPTGSRVVLRIEVSTDFNISADIARQRANRFLIMNLGDQLSAGSPELVVGERLFWRMPVNLTLSQGGNLGRVGDIQVDAQTGDVQVEPPQTLDQLADQAEMLYERATLPPRTGE